MSRRRPLPYHASYAVGKAEARLRQAYQVLDQGLDEEPPLRYAAIMAQASRLIADARLWLKEVERNGQTPDAAQTH